jgi:DNA-binding NarL/FixJ family response regulator
VSIADVETQLGIVRMALHHPQRIWVDTLAPLLSSRWSLTVVEAHTDPGWVAHAVRSGHVDVLLLHIEKADEVLAATLTELRGLPSPVAVVGLSESTDPHLLVSAVRGGVRGWVTPAASVDQLADTVQGVARGETWIPPALLTVILETLLTSEAASEEVSTAMSALSTREIDVLCCLVYGMSRQQIADRYVLSTHTVRTHINNLLRKLNVHSTLAAVSLAREAGLTGLRADP